MKKLQLKPLIEQLTISTKDATIERISLSSGEFAWCQRPFITEIERQYNLGKPVRIIVLKARQLGITTLSEAAVFNWSFILPGTSALVIAHETDTSQSAFEKNTMFWEYWPYRDLYKIKSSTQRRLTWEHGSSIRIATAKNVKSGRGRTIQVLHATECAFWDEPETLMTGLRQTIPNKHGTMIIIESTANGIGNWFHSTWEDAVAGENDYTPLFFPWWKHGEYRLPLISINRDHPDLDKEEQMLRKVGASLKHLEWRRFAIPSLCHGDSEFFKQEYPGTADEAFLTTGRNVFSVPKLDDAYAKKVGARGELIRYNGKYRFYDDPLGRLTVFRKPSSDMEHGQYMVSGDPSRTTIGDRACIQVLNRNTLEQVAVWHGKIDPVSFADEMAKIGYYYNTAELIPEMEGPGYATIGALIKMNYPKLWRYRRADRGHHLSVVYGWSTNYQRKHWMIGNVINLLYDGSLHNMIHDEETYHQMRNYVVLDNGEMGNARDSWKYDDAVMSYSIAIIGVITDGPVQIPDNGPLARHDIMGVPPNEAWGEREFPYAPV